MTVEEYQVGQLWSVAEASKAETGGGEGVEVLKNEPFSGHPLLNGQFDRGQYTHKIYHLASKVPSIIRKIAPKGSLMIHEEAWNAYPYCKTVLTNPDYMKDNFLVKVETIHLPDRGTTENAHGLSKEELAKREVVHIDIAKDNEYLNAADITPSTTPSTFVSSKTGRGPLTSNWKQTTEPVMCAYKLVTVYFKWFGLQSVVEAYAHKQYPRLFSKFHREVFCWIDNWHGLTMADIRAIEEKAQRELEEQRKNGSAVRDCVPDCPNMSDEWCGDGKTICDLGFTQFPCGQCVKPEEQASVCLERKYPCNSGIIKCAPPPTEPQPTQGRPEPEAALVTTEGRMRPTDPDRPEKVNASECDSGYFRCMDGSCLDETLVLDGQKDCTNGDDEDFCKMHDDVCIDTQPCSYQPDISAFGCGCPKGFKREDPGICRPENGPKFASNCYSLKYLYPNAKSGVKKLAKPTGEGCFNAYCDMESEGTLIFLRHTSSESNFNRSLSEYSAGFTSGEDFWLGLEILHLLTARPQLCSYDLIVNLTFSRSGNKVLLRSGLDSFGSRVSSFHTYLVKPRSFGTYHKKAHTLAVYCSILFTVAVDHLVSARGQKFLTYDTFAGLCKMSTGWWTVCVDCGKTAPTNRFL
ncbi:hypothetical protein WR25_04937 isoform B [Diploscapter pachys]|nr:hypothetical protein WR25_04937 isoform B [Diploscapter pachys]